MSVKSKVCEHCADIVRLTVKGDSTCSCGRTTLARRIYTAKDLATASKRSKAWFDALPSEEKRRVRNRQAQWRYTHSDRYIDVKKRWYQDNKERLQREQRERYIANRQMLLEKNHQYYLRNKAKYAAAGIVGRLRRKYKMTPAQFDALMLSQNGRCPICRILWSDTKKKKLVVDHNHATGIVRALLCDDCNVGLGRFKDSPIALSAAIAYLSRGAIGEIAS